MCRSFLSLPFFSRSSGLTIGLSSPSLGAWSWWRRVCPHVPNSHGEAVRGCFEAAAIYVRHHLCSALLPEPLLCNISSFSFLKMDRWILFRIRKRWESFCVLPHFEFQMELEIFCASFFLQIIRSREPRSGFRNTRIYGRVFFLSFFSCSYCKLYGKR